MCRPCCASALKRNARGSKPRLSPWTMGPICVVSLRDGRKAARCVELLPEAATSRLRTASAQAIGGYVASWITAGRGASGVVAFAEECRTLAAQAHQVFGPHRSGCCATERAACWRMTRATQATELYATAWEQFSLAPKCEGKSIITGRTLARPVCLCSSAISVGAHPAIPSV